VINDGLTTDTVASLWLSVTVLVHAPRSPMNHTPHAWSGIWRADKTFERRLGQIHSILVTLTEMAAPPPLTIQELRSGQRQPCAHTLLYALHGSSLNAVEAGDVEGLIKAGSINSPSTGTSRALLKPSRRRSSSSSVHISVSGSRVTTFRWRYSSLLDRIKTIPPMIKKGVADPRYFDTECYRHST
jgi:hypothetical protein